MQLAEADLQRLQSASGATSQELADWLSRHGSMLEAVLAANAPARAGTRENSAPLGLLPSYDAVVVAFSGGKDSLAALLYVLALLRGDRSRLELWHHQVDGEHGDLWDWPCTRAYCEAIAKVLDVPLYCSWREGGFEREMLRDGVPTAPMITELPDGTWGRVGGQGQPGTRLRFPQQSADLSVRYCSAYLKIDVAAAALRLRWPSGRVLLVTGERREESASRAGYARVERHKSTTRTRRIDQWRPILDWPETVVWEWIRAAGLVPHPAYQVGYGRLSCACCIFGGAVEWATFQRLRPKQWARLVGLEATFDRTLRRDETIPEVTARGVPFPGISNGARVKQLLAKGFDGPVRVASSAWELPAGAFRVGGGPV